MPKRTLLPAGRDVPVPTPHVLPQRCQYGAKAVHTWTVQPRVWPGDVQAVPTWHHMPRIHARAPRAVPAGLCVRRGGSPSAAQTLPRWPLLSYQHAHCRSAGTTGRAEAAALVPDRAHLGTVQAVPVPAGDVLYGGCTLQHHSGGRFPVPAAVQGGLVLRVGHERQDVANGNGRGRRVKPNVAVSAGQLLPHRHVHPDSCSARRLRPRHGQCTAVAVSAGHIHPLRGLREVPVVPSRVRVHQRRHLQAEHVRRRHVPRPARLDQLQELPYGYLEPFQGCHRPGPMHPVQPRPGVRRGGHAEQQARGRQRGAGGQRVHQGLRVRRLDVHDRGAAAPWPLLLVPRGLRVRRPHIRGGCQVPRRVLLRLRDDPGDTIQEQVSAQVFLPGGHGGKRTVPVPVPGVPLLPGRHGPYPAALPGGHRVGVPVAVGARLCRRPHHVLANLAAQVRPHRGHRHAEHDQRDRRGRGGCGVPQTPDGGSHGDSAQALPGWRRRAATGVRPARQPGGQRDGGGRGVRRRRVRLLVLRGSVIRGAPAGVPDGRLS
mmetsp:Transcript_2788/g.9812  ORF Transcript_2788/g.9812 Transcript_2788/m.9812 type:complete len:542 (-) Transcript_2788:4074-5699(-)